MSSSGGGAEYNTSMEIMEGIYTRRSIRQFTARPVEGRLLHEIIRAGTWAPSGLNNQPWRFVIVKAAPLRLKTAALTKYGNIIEGAPALIAVFLDKEAVYHKVKDHQAIGACIQNMLLAAHALNLGAVWLGEILKNKDGLRALLELPETLELMAIVAVGHPAEKDRTSTRRPLSEVLIKEV